MLLTDSMSLGFEDIGYQVGTGFMVGAPYQTPEYLAEDMLFLKELNPHMVRNRTFHSAS